MVGLSLSRFVEGWKLGRTITEDGDRIGSTVREPRRALGIAVKKEISKNSIQVPADPTMMVSVLGLDERFAIRSF